MYILDTCKVNEFRKTLMAAMDKIDELEQKERISFSFPSPSLPLPKSDAIHYILSIF